MCPLRYCHRIEKNGDSTGNRTPVTAVKGRCLDRLTMEPHKLRNRQRPAFPGSLPPSIIGAEELNFCVRDGNRCVLSAIATGFVCIELNLKFRITVSSKLKCLKTFWSSFRPISIGQLNALLHLHLRPINVVVSHGSYHKWRKSLLVGGFALRCFQRLSRPYVATQQCPWQNNWYTRGMSIPVLSY